MIPTAGATDKREDPSRDVRKKVVIAAEGYRTEVEYLEALKRVKREAGISSLVEIVVLSRFEAHSGHSDPRLVVRRFNEYMDAIRAEKYSVEFLAGLVADSMPCDDETERQSMYSELESLLGCDSRDGIVQDMDLAIEKCMEHLRKAGISDFRIKDVSFGTFHEDLDLLCVMADRDPGSRNTGEYHEFLAGCRNHGFIPFVASPKFELWLLMHIDPILDDIDCEKPESSVAKIDELSRRHGLKKSGNRFDNLICDGLDRALGATKFKSDAKGLGNKVGTNLHELIAILRE